MIEILLYKAEAWVKFMDTTWQVQAQGSNVRGFDKGNFSLRVWIDRIQEPLEIAHLQRRSLD